MTEGSKLATLLFSGSDYALSNGDAVALQQVQQVVNAADHRPLAGATTLRLVALCRNARKIKALLDPPCLLREVTSA